MKKILFMSVILLFCSLSANAMTFDMTKSGSIQEQVVKIGTKIMNANKITCHMNFDICRENSVDLINDEQYNLPDRSQHSLRNDHKLYHYREISLYPSQLSYVLNEDELAAILSHEIAHGVHSYEGWIDGYFRFFVHDLFFFNAKRTDRKMDKRAVDYMVNAGYDPVALITITSKQRGEKRTDWYLRTNRTTKKMLYVYNYIQETYPQYLTSGKYINDANFIRFKYELAKTLEKQAKVSNGKFSKVKNFLN